MRAVVVYESHWGNTRAVAEAIAEGIGPEAIALNTDQAFGPDLEAADLIVAGAPVIAFGLAGDRGIAGVRKAAETSATPPDLSHPSLRRWLESLPHGNGASASFETRVRWSPGGATGAIEDGLEKAGYRTIAVRQRFVVRGQAGPLREGELERARAWGTELAALVAPRETVGV